MKKYIVSIILVILLGMVPPLLFAQRNQNVPKTDTEVEKLKIQLQTVENEKMEIETKLAEANSKLINTEIDKYKRGLKDENDEWLRTWSLWFIGIIGFLVLIVGGGFWYWLRSRADQLIGSEIEKRINKFQEAIIRVDSLDDQMSILEKEHAVSVLQDYAPGLLTELERHSARIKVLTNEVLLDIFSDKTRDLQIKWVAANVLVARETPLFVSPALKFLNSIIDSDIDLDRNFNFSYDPRYHLCGLVMFVGKIHMLESYNGLKSFLKRLLTEKPKNKDFFIAWTAHSLASVSVALNKKDSIPILIESIPDWDFVSEEHEAIEDAANCFDLLNSPEGIKKIYNVHAKGKMSDVEEKCLDLLEKYDADFVKEQREGKASTNIEGEGNS